MKNTNYDFERLKAENENLKAEINQLKDKIFALEWDKTGLQEVIDSKYIQHLTIESIATENSYAWKNILNELPMGVFINGPQGVLWVNKAVESILGYSQEEYQNFDNSKIHEIVKVDTPLEYYRIADYFSKNHDSKYQIMEYQMKKKDGEYTWILSVHFPFIIKDGVCLANIGCAIDISSRKELELELMQANHNLEIARNKEKELMLKNQQMIKRQMDILKHELEQFSVKHLELIEFTNDIIELSNELENNLNDEAKQTIMLMKSKYSVKLRRDKLAGRFEDIITKVDPDFYRSLLHKHPELSNTEMKICYLIKLQITSLDISNILNLSIRTIEFHKYNIRKKLNLKRNRRLEHYLLELSGLN